MIANPFSLLRRYYCSSTVLSPYRNQTLLSRNYQDAKQAAKEKDDRRWFWNLPDRTPILAFNPDGGEVRQSFDNNLIPKGIAEDTLSD